MARDKKRRRSHSRSSSSSPERSSRRRRNRSRSRDRRRRSTERHRRSRSRDRRRSKERHRRSRSRGHRTHSASRSRSRSRDKRSRSRDGKRSRSHEKKTDEKQAAPAMTPLAAAAAAAAAAAGAIAAAENSAVINKNVQQQQLDLEMQKRRERIEKWRQSRKKTEEAAAMIVLPIPGKKWSLEDDEEDDAGPPALHVKDEPDDKEFVPPVKSEPTEDAAAATKAEDTGGEGDKQKEVRQLKDKALKADGVAVAAAEKSNKVTVIVGIAKKKEDKNKGELMEQNIDALEYSSEEEAEDLQTTMNNLQNNKAKKPATVCLEDISYAPFRKNFYIEVPELAKMTPGEVEALRAELEGIKVARQGMPQADPELGAVWGEQKGA
ncbi:hypothetical protein HPB48_008127 [Haemaphysalis longicornis]|uniref:Uncharacterized protein n=1 Tax=Haemaphysalis longicornis TaxID=44386 RepID=A0A9J6FKB7_HAELO|nr:hypothetical protein HPB48_008127 [Haemaphysalis longicornis]